MRDHNYTHREKDSLMKKKKKNTMAMNLIVIALITSSMAVSGFFSPNPQKSSNNGGQQVIIKERRREVAVEYPAGAGNTKASISPEELLPPSKGAIEEQLSRAAASVAGVAQDVKWKAKEVLSDSDGLFGVGPRELICDAFGRCEHRIAGVLRKAKERAVKAEEEVMEAMEKIKGLASRASRKVEKSPEGVRQNVGEKVVEVGEAAERVEEQVGEGEVVEDTDVKIKEKGVEGKKKFSHLAKRVKDVFWPKSVGSLMGVIQVLGFAMAYGMSMWVTFVMSHVLAGMLPRQQFGMVQSKLYPLYFKAMLGSIGLALLGHFARQRGRLFKNRAEMLQGVNLMVSLLSVLANLRSVEPRATKVMFEKMKMEKEEGRGRDDESAPATTEVMDKVSTDEAEPAPSTTTRTTITPANATVAPAQAENDTAKSKISKLDYRLKQLNAYSSLLNIATLMGLTWHLMYLGEHLALNS